MDLFLCITPMSVYLSVTVPPSCLMSCNLWHRGVSPIQIPYHILNYDHGAPTVYIPDFLAAKVESGDGDELIHIRDRPQCKNWLSDELVNEITGFFPNSDDIDPITGVREHTIFSENCLKLFPQDCIFASDKQIEQMTAMFLEVWAIPSLPCEHVTRKSKVQCPFKIAYFHHGKKASLKSLVYSIMPKLQMLLPLIHVVCALSTCK
jgi:hypothetical protein